MTRTTVNNATAAVLVRGIQHNTHNDETVDDYIQEIGIVPLCLSLYLQEQVNAFIADCKDTEGGILHIDATGSVVVKILSHSSAPIFLYSSVMSWYRHLTF